MLMKMAENVRVELVKRSKLDQCRVQIAAELDKVSPTGWETSLMSSGGGSGDGAADLQDRFKLLLTKLKNSYKRSVGRVNSSCLSVSNVGKLVEEDVWKKKCILENPICFRCCSLSSFTAARPFYRNKQRRRAQ